MALVIDAAVADGVCARCSTRRAYVSASAAELTSLKGVVVAAVQRGVDVVVLAFGRTKVTLKGARVSI